MSRTQRSTFFSGLVLSLRRVTRHRKIRTCESGPEDAKERRQYVESSDFGSFGNSRAGEKTAPYLCMVDHVSLARWFAVLSSKAVSDYVIVAMVASVPN